MAPVAVRLNKAQREAVEHDLGPLLVLAGAGSGKTGVVTKRIAALIKKGVAPRSILAMTFTNKAAGEMQERIVRLVGKKDSRGLFVGTFHRFGLEVLARETKALGLRGTKFAIVDRGDCSGIVRDALRRVGAGKSFDVGAIINRISLAKNAFLDPSAFAARQQRDEYDEITGLIYPLYQEALRSLQAFDFDDLVCEPVHLWQRRQDVRDRWRARFRYVIVDEYQDTNTAQVKLLRELADGHQNLCVVGDDDQAIYAWRGADVRNILDFERNFVGAKVVRLERNYRSTEAILGVANAVLEASQAKRHPKRLIPTQGPGECVQLVSAMDGDREARFVAEEAHRLIDSGTARPRDIAVLYRSNLQAPHIESALRLMGLPYQMLGGSQMFERKEVKDLIAYLSVAVAPHSNELALRRSLNYPARGVGPVALKRLASHATHHNSSLYASVERSHGVADLSAAGREGCREYARIVSEIQRDLEQQLPLAEVLGNLSERIGLKSQIWAECGQNNKAAARRWQNVVMLQRSFERRDNQLAKVAKRERRSEELSNFLRILMLREEKEDKEHQNKLTLTTMHAAKGLEFPYVFLIGLEEGLLPHKRVLEERSTDSVPEHEIDEVEQERRLFYVAVTRAKEHLYLCHAQHRPARGKLEKRAPSRFLLGIPEELLKRRDLLEQQAPSAQELQRGAADVLAALLGNSESS